MISLKTADSALKNVYLEVINNQFDNNIDPFFSQIEKTSNDISGSTVTKVVSPGVNGGIGAGAETGLLPTAKGNSYVKLVAPLKNLYAQLEISDKALRASANDSGAFLNLLTAEMENLIESSKFNMRRMLYGDGSSLAGEVTGYTSGSAVYTVDDAKKFMVGMRVTGTIDALPVSNMQNLDVLDVDYINNKVTVSASGAMSATVEEDEVFEFCLTNNYYPVTGLGKFFSNQNVAIFGVERAKNEFMRPNYFDIKATNFDYISLLQAIDTTKMDKGGHTDFIVTSFDFRREVQKLLKNNAINCDLQVLEGGFRTLSIDGIPLYANRFIGPKTAFLLDSSSFTMHQLCDWTWLSNDKGEILRQKEGYAAHSATLVKYCELIPNRMCSNSRITITA